MSDALLTEISAKLSELIGLGKALTKTGATATTATASTKPAATTDDAAKKAAAAKAAAEKAAAEKAAAAAKAATAAKAGPAANTKAAGGKYTLEQVREKIREVAANESLGKQSARDILDQDGGGVQKVGDLKPENYDKVYEACTVALQHEGKGATPATPEDDLM